MTDVDAGQPPDGGLPCLVDGTCKQNKDGSLYWPPKLWSGLLEDGGCIVKSGEHFTIDSDEKLKLLESCHFEGGSVMVFPNVEAEVGEAVDAGQVVTEPTARTPSVSKPAQKPAEVSAPAAAVEEAHAAADAAAAKAQAIVEQPVAAVAQLKDAIPADANIFTVLMGAIAVAGGGAAWKFYSDHSKRKHEQEMARIEKQDSQPGECKAHGIMKAEIAAVSSKVDAVVAKMDELAKKSEEQHLTMGDWDVDDFSERLEKVEKKVKKLKKGADGAE